MLTLAVDTCLDACTAVVGEDGGVLAAISEPMSRGHQERLAPMVAEVMAAAEVDFARLNRIAATVGPGSFTGLRVGLSFAKAMALALDIPCVGIGTLQALAHGHEGLVLAITDARRGQAYWQAFEDGAATSAPAASQIEGAARAFSGRGRPVTLTGPGSALLEGLMPGANFAPAAAPTPEALLALAATAEPGSAAPIYLRAPDAKLPGGRLLGE